MAFLNNAGLERLWAHIISRLNTKVDKIEGKSLSTEDFTTEEKEKLAVMEENVERLSEEIDELKGSGMGGNWGAENADKLLYIDPNGVETPLALGDGLKIEMVAGKNLLHGEWIAGRYDGNGNLIAGGIESLALDGKIPVTVGETYTLSITSFGTETWPTAYVHQFDKQGNRLTFASKAIYAADPLTFTVINDAVAIGLHFYKQDVTNPQGLLPNGLMLEKGSVATDYEPYTPSTSAITVSDVSVSTAKHAESISSFAFSEHVSSATVRSIAHRGAPGNAPECTVHAYLLAKKLGFRIAENDVAITADGHYVMWHDTTLKYGRVRNKGGWQLMKDSADNFYWTTNGIAYTYDAATDNYTQTSIDVSTLAYVDGTTIAIAEQQYNFLRQIDVGVWKSEKFARTQMLNFAEWLDLCKSLGMECYIDAKFTYTDEQAAELVSIVRQKGMLRKVSWLSNMESIRKADAKARCGILYAPTEGSLVVNGVFDKALAEGGEGSVFWNPPASDVTAENVAMALNAGYGYECWYVGTANTAEEEYYTEIERLLQCGVQGLSLDDHTVEEYANYKYGEAMKLL